MCHWNGIYDFHLEGFYFLAFIIFQVLSLVQKLLKSPAYCRSFTCRDNKLQIKAMMGKQGRILHQQYQQVCAPLEDII